MSLYQDVFQRYEKKYLLEEAVSIKFKEVLKEHMREDQYGKSTVCNLYYDTPDRRLIRTSLEKPVYKEKLRLRSYGLAGPDSTVFLELKKKYHGIVYKRRTDMTLREAKRLIRGEKRPDLQIEREIGWVLDFYPQLQPAMYLSYDRTAVCGIREPQLRITFDSRILWREEDLKLESGIYGRQLLLPGQRLMEIKTSGNMPLWLVHLLSELAIYPVSFSKYGRAYEMALEEKRNRKGVVNCA